MSAILGTFFKITLVIVFAISCCPILQGQGVASRNSKAALDSIAPLESRESCDSTKPRAPQAPAETKSPTANDELPVVQRQGVAPARPNIILMMADDMGWADIDFPVRLGLDSNGNEITYNGTPHWNTPNLAKMAANSLIFSRMYAQSPVCSPTRASCLTGRAPERIGIDFAGVNKLENREVTLAEYAQSLGYATAHLGKWHLGTFTRDVADANNGGPGSFGVYSTPLNHGFDEMYSTESKVSTHDPGTSGLTTTTRYWTGPGESVTLNSPDIAGDSSAIVARETNVFMEQAVNAGEPFLIVSWFHTPHKPTNTPGNTNQDNLTSYTYAMEDLDRAVGSIRAKVQALGIADNTLIMFTSDNGPEDGQDYNDEGLRNNKRELHEGGVREPGMIEWPTRIPAGVTHTPMVTTDYLPTILEIWGIDPVDNRPLDGQSMVATIFNDRLAERQKTIITKSTNGHQSAMGVGGRYKLISTNGGGLWTLYDIVMDYDENDPLATSLDIGSQTPGTQAIYNLLLSDYNAWAASVATSVSGTISGDYETRITSSNNVSLQKEPTENLNPGDVTGAQAKLYLERQYATVRDNLMMDSDGSLGQHNNDGSATLAKGTVVHSYLAHFNPANISTVNFSVTFEDKILGVIGENSLLSESDGLSFADPNFGTNRGLEGSDNWTISNEGKTISFSLTANNALDQARILTESSLQNVTLATEISAY